MSDALPTRLARLAPLACTGHQPAPTGVASKAQPRHAVLPVWCALLGMLRWGPYHASGRVHATQLGSCSGACSILLLLCH